jgi:hypothetical protein
LFVCFLTFSFDKNAITTIDRSYHGNIEWHFWPRWGVHNLESLLSFIHHASDFFSNEFAYVNDSSLYKLMNQLEFV